MNTWDACEQSWKNGYEKGAHDMARYIVRFLSIFSANKDALYEAIINDFKNRKEEETNA